MMNICSRKHAYLMLIMALALLLQACATSPVEQPTPGPAKLKVTLAPYLGFAPFFIAKDEGYFAEQGLEIEFVPMDAPEDAVPMLVTGEMDVAAGFVAINALNAIARGATLKYVADKGYVDAEGCTYWTMMVSPILAEGGEPLSPAQLQGQPVDVLVPSPESYYLDQVLRPAGLTLDDIEMMDIPGPPVEAEALAEGSLALGFFAEPWVSRVLQAGQGVVWMPSEQVVPDFQLAAIIYGPTLLEQNPDLGKRFMVAYLKAVRQYNEGKTERNLELIAENTGLERELLMEACWPPLRNDGQLNAQSILDFEAWALEKGLLDSTVSEEQFWDASFVEYANQVLETGSP
jgi:NitT/TauT family transport system substrate-binding protein